MKRSSSLAPLSRDHQHALDVALRLRRADAGTVGDAVARFRAFFEREGGRHFAVEERVLLPALPAEDAEWARMAHRIREDHAAIRAVAGRADELPVPEARALGERLGDHVRFEERVAFPYLERHLAPEALDRIGRDVEAADRG